ncbi:MAG: hypothetical protein JNJ46_07270 [Myxococcales bacterium]|nr:hypothetical protein [Myxococcales bacterium]
MKIVILHDDTHLFAGQKDFTSEAAQAVWSRLVVATMKPCDCRTPCRRRLLPGAEAVELQPVPSEVIQRIVSEWGVPVPEELRPTMMEAFIETLARYLSEADAPNVIENYDFARQALARHRLIREIQPAGV